jgi:hypothetical protein
MDGQAARSRPRRKIHLGNEDCRADQGWAAAHALGWHPAKNGLLFTESVV